MMRLFLADMAALPKRQAVALTPSASNDRQQTWWRGPPRRGLTRIKFESDQGAR
jgi:hypothetical protein